MAGDSLAKWRRPGEQPVSPGEAINITERENYRGDAGKDRATGWLELRPLSGPWSLVSYGQLRKVQFNGAKPTRIDLIFTFELIVVRGRNLEVLLAGLRSRTLAVIEEFNPRIHEAPQPDALFVEAIESRDNRVGNV